MTPLQENLIRFFCLDIPIAILLLGPKDAVLRHIWAHRHDEEGHLKTWHWETLTVMAVMAAVVLLTGNRPIEWIGWAALMLAHGRNSVMIRMSEAQQQAGAGGPHHVECHAWGTRYLWSGECFWACYFVMHRSWSALAGVAVFALFPLWRRWYGRQGSQSPLRRSLDELGKMQREIDHKAHSIQIGNTVHGDLAGRDLVKASASVGGSHRSKYLDWAKLRPVRVIIDDSGDQFSGWPSVEASEAADLCLIHRAGFKQEFWGDLSQKQAVELANLIANLLNSPGIPTDEMNSFVYQTIIGECERMENQQHYSGNGHHLAQRLAAMVAKAAQDRAKKGMR